MAGKASTHGQRAARDRRIRQAAASGRTSEQIADSEGVSVRTVFRILESLAPISEPSPLPVFQVLEIDPFAEVSRAIAVHVEAIDQARSLAARSRNEAIRLGSLRTAASLAGDLLAILNNTGLLLPDRRTWRTELGWRRAWDTLLEIAEAAGIDDEVRANYAAKFDDHRTTVARVGLGPTNDLAVAA